MDSAVLRKNEKKNQQSEQSMYFRSGACFLLFGISAYLLNLLILIAAQDILAGTELPTSLVLLVFASTSLAIKIVLNPILSSATCYACRFGIFFVFSGFSIGLIAVGHDVIGRLVGVAIAGIAQAVGEHTFLELSQAGYREHTQTTFSIGSGIATCLGSVLYAGVTIWSCVSPKTCFLMLAPWVMLALIAYFALCPTMTRPPWNGTRAKRDRSSKEINEDEGSKPLTWKMRFDIIMRTASLSASMFIGKFCAHLTLFAILTTLAYPTSGASPRDHYIWYMISYTCGRLFGRFYFRFISCLLPSKCLFIFRTPHIALFAATQIVHFSIAVLASWFRFIPYMWLVCGLALGIGVTDGMLYLNSGYAFYLTFDHRDRPTKRFALTFISTVGSVGVIAAALMGCLDEPYLKEHCLHHSNVTGQFCFTRSPYGSG